LQFRTAIHRDDSVFHLICSQIAVLPGGVIVRCSAAIFALTLSGLAALAVVAPARADSGPVIVIPSRPGIPVIINGRDASYAVVEGDWGLARPRYTGITVIGGSVLAPNDVYTPRYSYHPRYGRAPPLGRQEVEPPPDRELPEPAESFSRSWSTSSDPQPVYDTPRMPYRSQSINPPNGDMVSPTVVDPQTFPQDFNPSVIVDPRRRRR